MLKDILADCGLQPDCAADLLGVPRSIFRDWTYGNRPVPAYIVPELSSIFGVNAQDLAAGRAKRASGVWFKFSEGSDLIDADREVVLLIRKLGHFSNELDQLTNSRSSTWKIAFEVLKEGWEHLKIAAPADQGHIAADRFWQSQGFGHAVVAGEGRISGMGDVIRAKLRALGVLVIESPIPSSNLRGCSFYVGQQGAQRPCIFANTYKQDWFERNVTLVHELAHCVFDIETEQALLDYRDADSGNNLLEVRADSFARNVFVSDAVLKHLTSTKGLRWEALGAYQMALLVAYTQADIRTVLKSAVQYGYCSADLAEQYKNVKFRDELKSITERALSTSEFISRQPSQTVVPWIGGRRTTSIPTRQLRLPVSYVKKVLDTFNSMLISEGKAAEMLMMEREDFAARFHNLLGVAA